MSTVVGATRQLPWGDTLQGVKRYGSYGSRDILIISQDEIIQGEDIVHRRQAELTSNDKRQLERLDLPHDQWQDDASIMAARIKKHSDYSVTEVIKSRPGEPLTVKYAMKQIEIMMNNTQKDGGKLHVIDRHCKPIPEISFSCSHLFWTWKEKYWRLVF